MGVIEDSFSGASVLELLRGDILLVHGDSGQPDGKAVGRLSKDLGRAWGDVAPLETTTGRTIPLNRPASLVRLKSGAMGLTCTFRPGKEMIFRTTFYASRDEGKTWSEGVVLNPADPIHVVRCGSLFVRSNGDIVAPIMSWMDNPSPEIPKEREAFLRPYEYAFSCSYAMISADEGSTWRRSIHTLVTCVPGGLQGARCGFFPFQEPTAIELRDGRLMMIGRTNVGVPYRSFSEDGGMRWTMPVPMNVAASYAPLHVKRAPSTGDLVLIWNQASVWEMQHGLRRHRLSTAVSKDEGDTWEHFRNLESLDDVSRIEVPPVHDAVDCEDRFWQPADRARYHRAPGPLRCAYPTAIFAKDRFVATYEYGCRQDTVGKLLLKVQSLPVDWLYGKDTDEGAPCD